MFKNELATRIFSGLSVTIFTILMILLAPPHAFAAFAAILILIGNTEFKAALQKIEIKLNVWILHLVVAASIGVNCFIGWRTFLGITTGLAVAGFILLQLVPKLKDSSFKYYLIHLIWLPIPAILFSQITFFEQGGILVIFMGTIIAFNDSLAYLGGKSFGKHLLAPTLSPKKTIEGSVCGIIGGCGAGLVYAKYFNLFEKAPVIVLLILLLTICILGQIGDLVESKFKRFCGIKDSGNILPGHGGVLDRLDAMLFVAPFFFSFIILYQKFC